MTATAVVSGGPISVGRRTHHPLLAVGAVLLGAFLASFHSRLFSIGLPDLRGAFGLGVDEGAWLNTVAMGAQILVAPAIAWLATVFGVRRLLVVPSLVYAAVSLLIPFVRDYQALLALHLVHGLLLGAFVPATIMIIFRNLPMRWWLPAVAVYVFRQAFSLNAGVALFGYYIDHWGWEWLYWQDVLLAPLMGLLARFGTPHEPVNRKLLADADWGGMLLFGAGLTLLYAGLDQGNRLDWFESGTVTALLAGGAALMLAFFVNEALVREPWASADVILARNVGLTLLVVVLYTLTSVSNTALVPNFLATVAHLRPEQTGHLLLVYAGLPLFVLMPLAVYLLGRVDARLLVAAGLAAFAVVGWMGTGVTHDWGPEDFIPMALLQSFAHCFTFLPLVIFSLANSNPARATAISAYIQVIRLDGVVLASALSATWLRVREQVHSNLVGLHVGADDPAAAQALAGLSEHFAAGGGDGHAQALGSLAAWVQREATVLSYIDAFRLAFWVALAALVLLALTRPAPAGPFTPQRAGG